MLYALGQREISDGQSVHNLVWKVGGGIIIRLYLAHQMQACLSILILQVGVSIQISQKGSKHVNVIILI